MRASRPCRYLRGALFSLLMLGVPHLAWALINPNYTPVNLVRDSSHIAILRVAAPQDGQMTAEVVEMLAGEVLPTKTLRLDFTEAEDLTDDQVTEAFGGAETALGVLCIGKRPRGGVAVGALEIGTKWMGLEEDRAGGRWKLDRDPQDLETVWGGSARTLVTAIRYIQADPAASFPVASELEWARDASPGKLAGGAHGCLLVTLTAGAPPAVVVSADNGDRVFQAAAKGAPVKDITRDVGLTGASRLMAAGDFNGDGRADLASWDGTRVRVLLRGADGRFAAPAGGVPLADCRSLAALALEGVGCGLVAGCADGLALLGPDGQGGITLARRLQPDGLAALGQGGVCLVADFDADGAPDALQVFRGGLVLYSAVGRPAAPAARVVALESIANPTSAIAGDFDTDGQLDVMVGGDGGMALLARDEAGQWHVRTGETGELGVTAAVGEGAGGTLVCEVDVNGDGRQGVALLQRASAPTLFFNRGFACFGLSRTLELGESELRGAAALGDGQSTGIIADLDGDGAPDLLGVGRKGAVWVLYGKATGPRRFPVTLTLADPAQRPLTVTAVQGGRRLSTWVVRPGVPTIFGAPKAGRLQVQWTTPDGTAATRDVVVTAAMAVAL